MILPSVESFVLNYSLVLAMVVVVERRDNFLRIAQTLCCSGINPVD